MDRNPNNEGPRERYRERNVSCANFHIVTKPQENSRFATRTLALPEPITFVARLRSRVAFRQNRSPYAPPCRLVHSAHAAATVACARGNPFFLFLDVGDEDFGVIIRATTEAAFCKASRVSLLG